MKTIFADGLTEPTNPNGWGCCAFVVFDGDADGSKYLADLPEPKAKSAACIAAPGDNVTNNTCEYRAVRAALNWAAKYAPDEEVELRTDSQLVVRQISGAYACNKEHLRIFRDECRLLMDGLPKLRLVWVSREQNIPADELTRIAYATARRKAA